MAGSKGDDGLEKKPKRTKAYFNEAKEKMLLFQHRPGDNVGFIPRNREGEQWEGLYSPLLESLQNTVDKPRLLKHQLPPSTGSFK